MATLTDALTTGLWTVGAELSVLHASGVAGDGLTGPDLLADAAVVLPVVVGHGRPRSVDVHTALYRVAEARGAGRDRPHRLRLADEALEMFAAYLVAEEFGLPAARAKDVTRDWLAFRAQADTQRALRAAAAYWRPILATVSGT